MATIVDNGFFRKRNLQRIATVLESFKNFGNLGTSLALAEPLSSIGLFGWFR
jgi:hypothetical protein